VGGGLGGVVNVTKGNLNIITGGGSDFVRLGYLAGKVTVNGDVDVRGGSGGDTVLMGFLGSGTVTVNNGKLNITTGAGDDIIVLGFFGSVNGTNVTKTINGGAGFNIIIDNSDFVNVIAQIIGGAGTDRIAVADGGDFTLDGGSLAINGGDGDDTITVGDAFLVTVNDGDDTVTVGGAGSATVSGGDLAIADGAGNDMISIDNLTDSGGTGTGNLHITGGGGYDTVLVGYNGPVTVSGNVTAKDVNLFGLGNNDQTGPAVVVEGSVTVSAAFSTLVNDVHVEDQTTVLGNLTVTEVGNHETLGLEGTV